MDKAKIVDGVHYSKRSFLKRAGAFLGGIVLGLPGLSALANVTATGIMSQNRNNKDEPSKKLIFIAIDALHPNYLELDATGNLGGKDENRLMPNVRSFVNGSLWYTNAKAFLPAATDMNHLNALAGTSTAQNGIVGVWAQPVGWDKDGRIILKSSHLSLARDDNGKKVDTLFHAWKRKYPQSKTLLISGKEWVSEMFRQPKHEAGVDILVSGDNHPEYIPPPQKESFADPATDPDAACDPESKRMGILDGKGFGISDIMTRFYTGQRSLLTRQMEHFANHFPHDKWIVDATLEIFKRERPDMAYILLAQCDDAGHCIGNAWNPHEFVNADPAFQPPDKCNNEPNYQLVSCRNKLLFREAILDVMRDIDFHFGRLIEGLKTQGILESSTVILLSDHSAVNHLYSDDFASTDFMELLEVEGLLKDDPVYAFSVSSYGVLYWRDNKHQIAEAKRILESHQTVNPQTGKKECPWWVLDRNDMKRGIQGVCLPGELYHTYYVEKNHTHQMIWPDLFVLAKNGWQIPVYNGHIPNVGIKAPKWTPPFRVYNGGHGSIDTLPIVAAIHHPGGKPGINRRPIRIADLGVTAASLSGLQLRSKTVGIDLSADVL